MDLDKILDYQKKDIELRRTLDEVERHEYNKKLDHARTEFNTAKYNITESEKAAEGIITFFSTAQAGFESNIKECENLEKQLNSLGEEDLDSRRELVAKMESLRNQMADLEKKLASGRQKAEQIIHSYLDSQERGKKMRSYYNEIKGKLDAVKAEKEPLIQKLRSELDKIKPSIDPQLFEQYKAITGERKYPAIVEAGTADGGKNYTCRGCGLSLSQKTRSELIEKNLCRCENCRRMIYKK